MLLAVSTPPAPKLESPTLTDWPCLACTVTLPPAVTWAPLISSARTCGLTLMSAAEMLTAPAPPA